MKLFLSITLPILVASIYATYPKIKPSLNLFLMGFFRDVARIKARNRRYENEKALGIVTSTTTGRGKGFSTMDDLKLLILGVEEDIFMGMDGTTSGSGSNTSSSTIEGAKNEKGEDLVVYTRQELYDYGNAFTNTNTNTNTNTDTDTDTDTDTNNNHDQHIKHEEEQQQQQQQQSQQQNENQDNHESENQDEDAPQQLLISIFGRVYDVSAGHKFYGSGGRYELFSGHDITYALSTGCVQPSCIYTTVSMDSILQVPAPVLNNNNEDTTIHTNDDEKEEEEEEECTMIQMNHHHHQEVDEEITFCSISTLTEKELKEGKKWLHFFETHDSYRNVGVLEEGIPMEQLMDRIIEDDVSSSVVAAADDDAADDAGVDAADVDGSKEDGGSELS